MSKKQKIKKKATGFVPEKPSETRSASVPGQIKSEATSSPSLILFDKKTKLFLAIVFGIYVLISSLKIHTSNVATWDIFFGAAESESVIAGTPRFIRMDEWMITAPALMGQYEQGLPLKNEANGGGNAPIVFGLPIKDISTILRPSVWSYFVFDLERAFAFSWNFNIFFFLISMFLLFLLLTKNNFWLSVFGTFFVFLMPAMQWWSYSIGTYMMCLNGMLLSFIYLYYSKNILSLIISSLILIISIFSFIAYLYPPFQIPLVYLYSFILAGYLIREKKFSLIKYKWQLRAVIFTIAIIFLGAILYHYYQIAKDTFMMMMNTVYPGRRFSKGGNLIDGKLFADFFSMFMSDRHSPEKWQNICEASGGFMFFPVIFYSLGYYYFKYKKTDPLVYSISIFVVICLIYVLAGFPPFISKISLFSMSPGYRTLPILGIGNCVLLVCYVGSKKLQVTKDRISWIEFGIVAVASIIFIRLVSSHINRSTEQYFTANEVNIATLLVVASFLLARYKDFKLSKPALAVVIGIMCIKNAGVNPLTKGLSAILDNPLTKASKQIHEKDPDAGWALYGSDKYTHLLKANGINILNSVKYVPPLDQLRILDPTRQYDSIYNRYAWITMATYINPKSKDTVIFRKNYDDGYTIFMDPCSPRFKQLNVKYVVFDYPPRDPELRCMTKLAAAGKFSIYKRRDL